jgi:hypothetical protein
MAFLASSQPSRDTIGKDQSRLQTDTKTNPAFDLPDIGKETLNAGRFSGELKSGAAHRAAIGDS